MALSDIGTAGARELPAPVAADLAELYRDLHRHPELSFQEERTAGILSGRGLLNVE